MLILSWILRVFWLYVLSTAVDIAVVCHPIRYAAFIIMYMLGFGASLMVERDRRGKTDGSTGV